MEQSWQTNHNQYPFYQQNTNNNNNRQSDRVPASPSIPLTDDFHRRSLTHPQQHNFPPPQNPSNTNNNSSNHQSTPALNLPPFGQSFYSSNYQPNNQTSPSGAGGLNALSHATGMYGSHSALGPPNQNYAYPVSTPTSLAPLPSASSSSLSTSLPRQTPHSYTQSPRNTSNPYTQSSPATNNLRNLSPTNSPLTQLNFPGLSSGSGSSSSFPSSSRQSVTLPKSQTRSRSAEESVESWDEGDGRIRSMGEDDTETDNQPWGMPQDEYKALNPRDKKQVRNRIGARRFRAKRKDYVSTLEAALKEKDQEIAGLRAKLEAQRLELDDLKEKNGTRGISHNIAKPVQVSGGGSSNGVGVGGVAGGGGLGLMGANNGEWASGFKKELGEGMVQ